MAEINYLRLAAAKAEQVYGKVLELKCVHKSGAKDYAAMVAKKAVTCASSASIAYQMAGILPAGKVVNHRTAVGGSDAAICKRKNTIAKAMSGAEYLPLAKVEMVWVGKRYADLPAKYRKKGVMYIQDSNVCICAGGGAIYSCNNAKSQLDSKGRYIKDKVTGGYPFTSPILVIIVPKVVAVDNTTTKVDNTAQKKEVKHDMDTIRNGDKGQQIRVLQKLLGGLDVDGDFGPKTEAAVKAYQKARKLDVDGIVGPKTWAKLLA